MMKMSWKEVTRNWLLNVYILDFESTELAAYR